LTLSVSVCMYVCLSVTVLLQIASFLFLDGIELFFDRQFSTWHSTKLFFFDFWFVTPKIYSPKLHCHKIAYKSACMPDRPDVFGPTRGDDQGADLCCYGNDIFARRGV